MIYLFLFLSCSDPPPNQVGDNPIEPPEKDAATVSTEAPGNISDQQQQVREARSDLECISSYLRYQESCPRDEQVGFDQYEKDGCRTKFLVNSERP